MNELFPMIFKRKSFKKFDDNLKISKKELNMIKKYISNLIPLMINTKIAFKIVNRTETTCTKGEYCLLVYSEFTESSLLNLGYMVEQIDLFMTKNNIGTCWYGKGKPLKIEDMIYDKLDFVIMLSFGKAEKKDFRKDYTKAKRKDLDTIWMGKFALDVANVVRYAPSTGNIQPWRVYTENNLIKVYRETNIKSSVYKDKVLYYNTIDMGIFIYFLDITLNLKGYKYTKISFNENQGSSLEPILEYIID